MVLICNRSQSEINRIMRPNKRRFGKAKRAEPFAYMKVYAERTLRRYHPQQVIRYKCNIITKPPLTYVFIRLTA